MRKKLIVKKRLIGFYGPHEKYLQQAENDGHEVSEILRNLVLEWGQKMYPPVPVYAQALKKKADIEQTKVQKQVAIEEMSNEEYATEVVRGQLRPNGKGAFRIGGGREI